MIHICSSEPRSKEPEKKEHSISKPRASISSTSSSSSSSSHSPAPQTLTSCPATSSSSSNTGPAGSSTPSASSTIAPSASVSSSSSSTSSGVLNIELRSTKASGTTKRKRKSLEISSSVTEELQCPICFVRLSSPIHQCSNGHLVCNECQTKLAHPKKCPQCRTPMQGGKSRRAWKIEKIISLIHFPCKHGCGVVDSGPTLRIHEDRCSFRPYPCPHAQYLDEQCHWKGQADSVIRHISEAHFKCDMDWDLSKDIELQSNDTALEGVFWCGHDTVNERTLLVQALVEDDKFSMCVRHVGDGTSGMCRIRVSLKGNRTVIWEGPVTSIREPVDKDGIITVSKSVIPIHPDGDKVYFAVSVKADVGFESS